MTMDQQPTAQPTNRAAYQHAQYAARRQRQQQAPAVLLKPVLKPIPEKAAVQRAPWHFGDTGRTGCSRYGDDDWAISPENDRARFQPGGGSAFGKAQPAPVR
jgi:hypothetical protein